MSLKQYVRVCVSLKKEKSQGTAVDVTVNSKEVFVWISSQNSALGYRPLLVGGRNMFLCENRLTVYSLDSNHELLA